MLAFVWDGITRAETLHEDAAQIRQTLAETVFHEEVEKGGLANYNLKLDS